VFRFDFITYFIFAFLVIIWGCAYYFMKQALLSFTPLQTAALRIAIATLVMLPFAIIHYKKIPNNKWAWLLLTGFLGNGIPAYLFMLALQKVDSNIAGILNALTPIWVLVIGYLIFNKKVTRYKTYGILIGFAGLSFLYLSKGAISTNNLEYTLLILAATFCYGLNINVIEHKLAEVPSRLIGYCSLLLTGLVYIIFLLKGIDGKTLFEMPLQSTAMVYIIVLGAVGTALTNILFFVLMKRSNTNFATMVTYLMPFVSIAIGYATGEIIAWQSIICFGLILVGVYLVKKKV
jgi:drug/metabolite transporter (DMT)-like permease